MVTLRATPTAAPPGFLGCSIDEAGGVTDQAGPVPGVVGSARVDAAGAITLRGSGSDIGGPADGCYFLSQPVTGDFRLTVRLLAQSTPSLSNLQAGLMVRESLEAGSRQASLLAHQRWGVVLKWRPMPSDPTEIWHALPRSALKLPILLRLTRHGNTITAEYSTDNGRQFQPAGDPLQFEPALERTLYAGLAITSYDVAQIGEAKFRDLRIEALAR